MDSSCEQSRFVVQACGTSWSGAIAACEEFDMPTMWGRMASCGRLEIGLLLIFRKLRHADFQSAAGYQPAPHNQNQLRRSSAVHHQRLGSIWWHRVLLVQNRAFEAGFIDEP